jgi:RNA polymerase sigma-70 factor, ECF subfamily
VPSFASQVPVFDLLLAAIQSLGALVEPAEDSALEDLMGRYADGDLRAFDELFRRVSPRLYGYLVRLTRRPDRAEDLVQITFAKVHRARTAYLRGAPVLPWVFAIGRRAFLDEVRRSKSRHEDLSLDGSLPEAPRESPLLSHDLADALERAMHKLPRPYAEAIQLLKITGLSVRDAAEVLGASESAVKLRAHRGYVLLRKELGAFSRLPEEMPS